MRNFVATTWKYRSVAFQRTINELLTPPELGVTTSQTTSQIGKIRKIPKSPDPFYESVYRPAIIVVHNGKWSENILWSFFLEHGWELGHNFWYVSQWAYFQCRKIRIFYENQNFHSILMFFQVVSVKMEQISWIFTKFDQFSPGPLEKTLKIEWKSWFS